MKKEELIKQLNEVGAKYRDACDEVAEWTGIMNELENQLEPLWREYRELLKKEREKNYG